MPSRKNQRPFGVLKTDGKVKCRSGIHPNKRLLDQQRIRLIAAARRVASRWLTAVLLAVIWTSALGGSLHARQSQGDLVGTRHPPARNVNFRTAGDYGPGVVQESSRLPRLSQAVTGDQLQKASSREHYRPELPAPPQGAAIEVQKSLRQERERAERLEQALSPAKRLEKPTLASNEKQASQGSAADLQNTLQQFREWADRLEQALAPAKREIETQTAITGKKIDEATHLKQSAESGVELQKSLQQERERAERLRQDIATAKRELDTQIAMAAKANDEMIRLKQAAESGAELRMSLQQERELAAQLREDLATAKREFETQTALANKANDEVIRLKQAAESGVELQKSLQQERERATQLREDLATANRELETQTALANKANEEATRLKRVAETGAKLENFRRQGQERTSQLQQNLAAAKREVETQTALVAKANEEATRLKQAAESGAKLEKALQEERGRATQLEQDLASAKREVETQTALAAKTNEEATRLKQAAESGAKLEKALQEERGRATQLEQDLASAKREVETQTALVAKANEEANRVATETGAKLKNSRRQGQEQVTQLQQDLATAKREVEAQTALVAKANEEANRVVTETGAKLENSRRQGQEQVTQLQQELAAAKREVETQTALAAKANEEATRLKQAAESATVELKSVQQERGRAAQLQQDLAMVKREIERKDALARDLSVVRTRSYACQEPSEAVLSTKPLAEADGFRKSLQWRRNPAKQLERALILAEHGKDSPPWIATVAVSQMARNELLEAPPLTVANARANLQPDPADAVEAAKLRARAGVLLGQGDIGAARVVLERAAEKGSAQAMFELAETYDPLILPRWRTYGTRGDATKARDLYAKAETDGIKEAKQRSDALRLVDR